MSGTVHRELRPLALKAQEQGWTITVTRKNHLKWVSPEGCVVISSGTPSSGRAVRETLALLRRAGLDV